MYQHLHLPSSQGDIQSQEILAHRLRDAYQKYLHEFIYQFAVGTFPPCGTEGAATVPLPMVIAACGSRPLPPDTTILFSQFVQRTPMKLSLAAFRELYRDYCFHTKTVHTRALLSLEEAMLDLYALHICTWGVGMKDLLEVGIVRCLLLSNERSRVSDQPIEKDGWHRWTSLASQLGYGKQGSADGPPGTVIISQRTAMQLRVAYSEFLAGFDLICARHKRRQRKLAQMNSEMAAQDVEGCVVACLMIE